MRRGWRAYRSCPDLQALEGLDGRGSERGVPWCSSSPVRAACGMVAGGVVEGRSGWNGLRLDSLDCLVGVEVVAMRGFRGAGSGRCAYAHADGLVRGTLLRMRMHTQIFRL